jgi:hypothetical protein
MLRSTSGDWANTDPSVIARTSSSRRADRTVHQRLAAPPTKVARMPTTAPQTPSFSSVSSR